MLGYNRAYSLLVVQKENNASAIHWINHYPADNAIGFRNICPLDSDLSDGYRYPAFDHEQRWSEQ